MKTFKFEVLRDVYLTTLTHNDSYMIEVPKGTIVEENDDGDIVLPTGEVCIDNQYTLAFHGYLKRLY